MRSLEALSGLVSVARETANHAGKRGVERGDGGDKGGNASASASSSVSRIRQCLSSDDVRDLLSSRGHLTSRWDDGDEAAILTAVRGSVFAPETTGDVPPSVVTEFLHRAVGANMNGFTSVLLRHTWCDGNGSRNGRSPNMPLSRNPSMDFTSTQIASA